MHIDRLVDRNGIVTEDNHAYSLHLNTSSNHIRFEQRQNPQAKTVFMEKTTEPSTGVQYEQEADRGGWHVTLPGSNTQILVQMDYSQTSRKAYKRHHQAKASKKYSQKKKEIQGENIRKLQELRDEIRQMSEEIDHLRRQHDFDQQEINQLRHILCRTAGIHQHAAGSRNQILTTSVGSHTDQSPVFQHLMPTPTRDYASNLGSVDYAAQRPKREEWTSPIESGLPLNMALTGLAAPQNHFYRDPPRCPSPAAASASENRPP